MKHARKRDPGSPKVLIFDIETAPILAYAWGLWDQTIALNQIDTDWYVLSWAAKWLDGKEVMYQDKRNSHHRENDKSLLKKIWNLLNEADIVITQNGKKFDQKKLNARFIINGFKPPSSYKHIDTLQIAKKHFGFTSNKLEYMTEKLCKKFKKLKHSKFPGFELWKECLSGNMKAWEEMERYNKRDILATEELYSKLIPWDGSVKFSLYNGSEKCRCGGVLKKNGRSATTSSIYQRYRCSSCGEEARGKENLLSPGKKKSLKVNTSK